jgi:hypothetical protein
MATSTRRNSKKTTPSRNELVNDPLAAFIPVKNRQTRENNKKSQKVNIVFCVYVIFFIHYCFNYVN